MIQSSIVPGYVYWIIAFKNINVKTFFNSDFSGFLLNFTGFLQFSFPESKSILVFGCFAHFPLYHVKSRLNKLLNFVKFNHIFLEAERKHLSL